MRIAVVAGLLLSGRASALTCDPAPTLIPGFPDGGAVPSNGELVVFTEPGEFFVDLALSRDGSVVPHEVVPVATGVVQVVPFAPLQEGGVYTLAGAAFTVGGPVLAETPAVPDIAEAEVVQRPGFGDEPIEGIRLDIPVDGDGWVEVELSATGDFTDAERFGSPDGQFSLGRFDCGTSFAAYDAELAYTARARRVGVTGERSDWSDPERARRGCSVAAGGATAFGALWGLGLLLLGRRR